MPFDIFAIFESIFSTIFELISGLFASLLGGGGLFG